MVASENEIASIAMLNCSSLKLLSWKLFRCEFRNDSLGFILSRRLFQNQFLPGFLTFVACLTATRSLPAHFGLGIIFSPMAYRLTEKNQFNIR